MQIESKRFQNTKNFFYLKKKSICDWLDFKMSNIQEIFIDASTKLNQAFEHEASSNKANAIECYQSTITILNRGLKFDTLTSTVFFLVIVEFHLLLPLSLFFLVLV